MLTQTEPLPEDDRSEAELLEAELQRTIAQQREAYAMRNARCAELGVNLERVVELLQSVDDEFDCLDARGRQVLRDAKRCLGLPVDGDEHGAEGF